MRDHLSAAKWRLDQARHCLEHRYKRHALEHLIKAIRHITKAILG